MRVTYRADELTLSSDGVSPKRRAFNDDDRDKLEALAGSYAQMVRTNALTGLEDLGRDIHDWLDGAQRDWLQPIKEGSGPRPIEFVIDSANLDDPSGRAFLEVPWEVMANERGFLAGDGERPLVLSRRIGDVKPSPAPSHSDILLMFMAAQSDGVGDLDIEREEVGILEVTAQLPVHLRVEESGCLDFLGPRMAVEARAEALHLSCHGGIENGEPVLMLEDAKGPKAPDSAWRPCPVFG